MKVVINKCFGGFSLSPKAVKRMAELQGRDCYFYVHDFKTDTLKPTTLEKACSEFMWSAFDVPNINDVLPKRNKKLKGQAHLDFNTKYNALYEQHQLDNRPKNRADPLLVQVVEELGEEANGSCASLEIVEIPDDVSWEIDEYDGMERVEEVHRSWG